MYAKSSSRDGVPACLFGCGVMWTKPLLLAFMSAGAYRNMVRYCLDRDFTERHESRFQDRVQQIESIDAKIDATTSELRTLQRLKYRALYHHFVACPTQGCIGVLVRDTDDAHRAECLVCSRVFCADCLAEAGDPESTGPCDCSKIVTGCEASHVGLQRCPVCRIYIEKDGGCDSMFCINCHASFSWTSGGVTDSDPPEDAQLSLPNGRLAELSASGGAVVLTSVYAYRDILQNQLPYFNSARKYDPLSVAVYVRYGVYTSQRSRGEHLLRRKEQSDYAAVVYELYITAWRRLHDIFAGDAARDEAALAAVLDDMASGLFLCASEHGQTVQNDAFLYRRVAAGISLNSI
jgi:hypothetical protein